MGWFETLNNRATVAIKEGDYPLARNLIVLAKRVVAQEIASATAERQMRRLVSQTAPKVPECYDPRQVTRDLVVAVHDGIEETGAKTWDEGLVRYVGEHFGWGLPDSVMTREIQLPRRNHPVSLDPLSREDEWFIHAATDLNSDIKSFYVQTISVLTQFGFKTVGMIRNQAVRDIRGLAPRRSVSPERAQVIAGILMERY